LKSFPHIAAGMTDPKTLGWAGHVTLMKETGKAKGVRFITPQGKCQLGRIGTKWMFRKETVQT